MPPPVVTSDFHLTAKPFIDAAKNTGIKNIVLTTALYSDKEVSKDYTSLTGKSASTFTDFVKENRNIFLGTN